MKLNISESWPRKPRFQHCLLDGFFRPGWNRIAWGERDLRGNIDPLKKSGEIKESTEYEMSILYMKERLL